jgi:hypothetical protein
MSVEDYAARASELNSALLVFSALTPMIWVNYFFKRSVVVLRLSLVLSTVLLVLSGVALWKGVLQVTYVSNASSFLISLVIAIFYYRKQTSKKWVIGDD